MWKNRFLATVGDKAQVCNAKLYVLTHLPLDRMAAILTDIFKCNFLNEKFCILIEISLKFVPSGLIDNKLALV